MLKGEFTSYKETSSYLLPKPNFNLLPFNANRRRLYARDKKFTAPCCTKMTQIVIKKLLFGASMK